MNPKSNELGYSSFEAGMSNLSLGEPPMTPRHQQYYGQQQQQQSPNYSGEWNQGLPGQSRHEEDSDEDDDQPLSSQQQQQQQGSFSRPVSIRNMAAVANSARPSNFIKPAVPQSNKSIVPQDMHVIQDLYETYSQKVYLEGYVYKKNDLTVDGKSFGDPHWSRLYAELCGPVLTLWDTEFEQDENVMPQYINITDSNVELIGRSGEPGRENVFSLNSAGANRYFIDVPDFNTLVNWVCAIRLSCFECSRLQEIYTRSFIIRPTYSDLLAKPMSKMEGFVQVRFSGTTEWQKYWVVVSDRKEEKKLFGKKSVQSRGQMMFYESKKAKSPVMTMVNVVQAYTIYPESPQLIDLATMLKVEGSIFNVNPKGEQQPATSFSSVLLMASSPKELVQWIIGTYDAFKLYGRPGKLIDEPNNINSLNFGEPVNGCGLPRLFLEVPEVVYVNFRDENLLDNKAQFAGILLHKIQQQQPQPPMNYRQSQQPMGLIHQIPSQNQQNQQPTGLIHQIPSGAPMYNNQSPHPNSQRMSTMSGYANQPNMRRPPINNINNQQQQRMSQAPGRVIYASDEDSEEEDDNEEEEDSDHDSVFKPQKNITRESLSLPTMSTEDDGFASSILGNIEKKSVTSPTPSGSAVALSSPTQQETLPTTATASAHASNTSLPNTKNDSSIKSPVATSKEVKKSEGSENEFGLSDSEDEAPRAATTPAARRPKPKMAATRVSLSGSDEEDDATDEEDDDEEGSYSGSDDDVPIHQQGGRHPQQQQQQNYLNNVYGYDEYGDPHMQQQQWESASMYNNDQHAYYDEDGYPIIDEDGPVIPQLGDRFATQNSLLDSYRPDHPSARDQEGYARATGQPLIQVPNKPPEPRAGLVGMISQIEQDKKHKESNKNRFADMEKERMMERERERYMMDQRSQMMPMMGQGMNMMGQPMMDPRMMMNMQMMGGQMPMMNMMGQPMMYPGMNPAMMQQNAAMMQNPGMMNMNMQMMPPMMDPRMSMMMMQQRYGQYPMWNQQQAMYGNNRFNGHIQEDDDEDDDVPLGAKESPIPRNNNQ